jgi:hypothetical protein
MYCSGAAMSSAPSMSLIQQSLVACHRQASLHGSWRAPRCIVGRHALDGAAIKPAVTPEQSTPAVANVNGGRSLKHGTHQSLLPRQKRRPTSIWVSACKPRLAQPQRVPKRREVNHTQSAQLLRPCEPRPSDLALPAICRIRISPDESPAQPIYFLVYPWRHLDDDDGDMDRNCSESHLGQCCSADT